MRILVTGGSGFVGRHTVRRLAAAGDEVVAVVRSPGSAGVVSGLGAAAAEVALLDEQGLVAAMAGADAVVHLAAETDLSQPWSVFRATNVRGTATVLSAAAIAGVPTFVHISTEAVLAEGRPLRDVDESAPLAEHPAGRYSATKAEAERAVHAAAGIPRRVILRPRMIWGPEDTTLLPQFIAAARSGKLMWFDGGSYLTSTAHVDHVVDAIGLVLRDASASGTYFVTDGEPVEFKWFVSGLLRSQAVEPPTRSIPLRLLTPVARLLDTTWSVGHLPGKAPISFQELALMGMTMTFDDSRIRDELGFTTPRPVAERLDELGTQA